jgi:hypothetical protein
VVPVASADVAAPVAPAHAAPHVAAAVEPPVSPVAVVDHDGPIPAPAPQHRPGQQTAEQSRTGAEPSSAVERLAPGVDRRAAVVEGDGRLVVTALAAQMLGRRRRFPAGHQCLAASHGVSGPGHDPLDPHEVDGLVGVVQRG